MYILGPIPDMNHACMRRHSRSLVQHTSGLGFDCALCGLCFNCHFHESVASARNHPPVHLWVHLPVALSSPIVPSRRRLEAESMRLYFRTTPYCSYGLDAARATQGSRTLDRHDGRYSPPFSWHPRMTSPGPRGGELDLLSRPESEWQTSGERGRPTIETLLDAGTLPGTRSEAV